MEKEQSLIHCEKRWVVNRIVDKEQEARIISLLLKFRQKFIHIPFELEEYARCRFDISGLPRQYFYHSPERFSLPLYYQVRASEYPFRYKNLYAMNNNGARNAALEEGRHLAEWVMPWDGNCFLTQTAWESILKDMESLQDEKYLIVPLTRVHRNQDLLDYGFKPDPVEEPQIIFRHDALETFDEHKRFGYNPKVDLLRRLKVPGPWDEWEGAPWEQHKRIASDEAGKYHYAGWVARLSSFALKSEKTGYTRSAYRINGIVKFLSNLDEQVLQGKFCSDDLIFYDETALSNAKLAWSRGEHDVAAVVDRLLAKAESLLDAGPYSLLDKTSIPPSGKMQDYLSPAPHWLHNPAQPDAKAEWHDGKRLREAKLYCSRSNKFDRTRLQLTFDQTTLLALAWYITGDNRYADRAALLIKTWFLNPETSMNPHLRYAQTRLGEWKEQLGCGIIETKDFYFFLDSVRLVFRSERLSPPEQEQFKEWCRNFLDWIVRSSQGRRIFMSQNNHGTYYDLQVASLAAFLNDTSTLLQILRASSMRAAQQFNPDGSQPEELKRSNSLHYCVFNLQGWANIARIARVAKIDLWNTKTQEGGSPSGSLSWISSFPHGEWPYRQESDFDYDRLVLLNYLSCTMPPAGKTKTAPTANTKYVIKSLFHPYAGVQPYWCIGVE